MERGDILLNLLSEQRNVALDQLASVRADLIQAAARVKALEAEVAALTPQSGGGPGEEKSGGGPGEEK